ncbi:MAG: hypothetical protein ABR605_00495, partial [Desulfurivibrionaceae bacterium]
MKSDKQIDLADIDWLRLQSSQSFIQVLSNPDFFAFLRAFAASRALFFPCAFACKRGLDMAMIRQPVNFPATVKEVRRQLALSQ